MSSYICDKRMNILQSPISIHVLHFFQSHGTHCAGTISAQNDNNIGVAGIAGGKGGNAGASLMVRSTLVIKQR